MLNEITTYLSHPQLLGQLQQQTLPLIVLGVSLLGSLHCVGMCGGIVMALPASKASHRFYHSGRLLGYLFIGGLAGFAGAWLVDYQQTMARGAAVLLSISFVWLAVHLWRGNPMHITWPGPVQRWLERGLGHFLKQVSQRKVAAGGVGFLTVLMPCGWLYSFVLGALLTGSTLKGALFLGMFWLGTLPSLVWGPGALSRWLRSQQKLSQKLLACVFICIAAFNISQKFNLLTPSKAASHITAEHLHDLTRELNCH